MTKQGLALGLYIFYTVQMLYGQPKAFSLTYNARHIGSQVKASLNTGA